ncbi:MAG: HAD family hydrolase [Candidatus Hydrogenedentes bacterium]|nr:HAD family hydrolase [Candidatus Hydrogenedentota bacterium]
MRAVTFDFWGTLFRDHNGGRRHEIRAAALADAAGVAPEDASRTLHAVMAEFFRRHLADARTLTPRDAVAMAAELLGREVPEDRAPALAECFATVILDHPPAPVEGALDAVRAAAALGPVGVISDTGITPGRSLRVLLEREGFTPHLRRLTFSDEMGVAKPHPGMFTRTAEALGVDPSDILHLGDLEPTDIAGIHGVGGKGGLFTGVNDAYADQTSAEHEFASWAEFTAWLR